MRNEERRSRDQTKIPRKTKRKGKKNIQREREREKSV